MGVLGYDEDGLPIYSDEWHEGPAQWKAPNIADDAVMIPSVGSLAILADESVGCLYLLFQPISKEGARHIARVLRPNGKAICLKPPLQGDNGKQGVRPAVHKTATTKKED